MQGTKALRSSTRGFTGGAAFLPLSAFLTGMTFRSKEHRSAPLRARQSITLYSNIFNMVDSIFRLLYSGGQPGFKFVHKAEIRTGRRVSGLSCQHAFEMRAVPCHASPQGLAISRPRGAPGTCLWFFGFTQV